MRGFGEIAERLRRSTVQIFNGADRGRGSGIVWSAGGLILTNAHVARTSRSRNRALGRPPLPGSRRLARPAARPCHPAHHWGNGDAPRSNRRRPGTPPRFARENW